MSVVSFFMSRPMHSVKTIYGSFYMEIKIKLTGSSDKKYNFLPDELCPVCKDTFVQKDQQDAESAA